MKRAWHVVEPENDFVDNWHIRVICEHLEAITDGRITRLLINIPPGPMRVDSLVETGRGQMRLDQVSVGDTVLTHRGRYRRVLATHRQGVLPILKIVTNSGRETFAAPSHPYLTPRGWVDAGDLTVGDVLAVVNRVEDRTSPVGLREEEARFLGYIVGNGSVTHSPTFVNCDREVIDDFIRCANALGFKTSERRQGTFWKVGISGARPILTRHGLLGKNSYTKRAPSAVLNGNREVIANFLGAYWSCDGGVDVRMTRARGSRFRTYATTVSEALAFDLVHLLAAVGIESRLRRKCRKLDTKAQPGGVYRSFSVEVQSEPMAARVIALPGLCSAKKARGVGCRGDFDRVLWNDPIVSIEPQDPAECMCLTVEEDHSFTCSGIAVKNTMKSLLVSVLWPAWEWGPKGKSSYRYFTTTYAEDYAIRDSRRMRDLVESEWYKTLWGDRVVLTKTGEKEFHNTKTGWRKGVPFTRLTGGRGDRLIIDDPHSTSGADSDAERRRAVRLFRESATSRLNNAMKSAIVVIMQRLHEGDISGQIIENGGYVHLMLPMEFDPDRRCRTIIGFVDPRKERDELLFPALFPREAVDRDKQWMGSFAVAGQYQQEPVPRQGGMFKRHDFKIVDAVPAGGNICRGWDHAASDENDSPATAGVLIKFVNDEVYIMDCKREQLGPAAAERLIESTVKEDARLYGSETRQDFPQDPGSAGKVQKAHLSKKLSGYNCRFSPETGSKETRALPLAAQVEAGNVYILKGDWNTDFLDEVCMFPRGKFKDRVDAMTRAYGGVLAMPKTRSHGFGMAQIS